MMPATGKTSVSHPLRIAEVSARSDFGLIGITFCPGKYERFAHAGFWDRNLAIDLDLIRKWGAAAVVTLLRNNELKLLRVEGLGQEVERRGMRWFHLPIDDVSVPDKTFEEDWIIAGGELRTLLRDGAKVLVHCRGGLGRAGTIGARLLIELGMGPVRAIDEVRTARPGAIETLEQEQYVLSCRRAER